MAQKRTDSVRLRPDPQTNCAPPGAHPAGGNVVTDARCVPRHPETPPVPRPGSGARPAHRQARRTGPPDARIASGTPRPACRGRCGQARHRARRSAARRSPGRPHPRTGAAAPGAIPALILMSDDSSVYTPARIRMHLGLRILDTARARASRRRRPRAPRSPRHRRCIEGCRGCRPLGIGCESDTVSRRPCAPARSTRRRSGCRLVSHRRRFTTSSWKLRTESSHTGESTPPPAAASDTRPCWRRSQTAWSSRCTSRQSLASCSARSADPGFGPRL